MNELTRREFLRLAGLMGGASLFAGCHLFGDSDPVPRYIDGAPAVDPLETLEGIKNIYSVCGLCAGNCGICCRIAHDTLVKIGGSPYNPISVGNPLPWNTPPRDAAPYGGSVCAVGGSGIQTLYNPFRVAKPLKRVGPRGSGKWQGITWDQAFKEIVDGGDLFGEGKVAGLRALKDAGQGLSFQAGRMDWGSETFVKGFLAAFPGATLVKDREAAASTVSASAAAAVFGSGTGQVYADYRSARFLLSWGDAPLDSGVPIVSIAREISDARVRESSMRWAVVDPRLSTSASKSDLWLPIIPGTDLYLALAIFKALHEHHAAALVVPAQSVAQLVQGRTIAEYAKACGLSAEVPVRLAQWLAEAGPRSAVIPGGGILGQPGGEETAKAILALNLAVGSVPGTGGLVTRNADFLKSAETAILGSNARKVQASETGGTVRALVTWNADPVYDDPGEAAYFADRSKMPLFVAIDTEITETSALADYILPDTTYLERWDVCLTPTSSPGFGVRVPVVGGLDQKTGEYFPILPENKLLEDILIGMGAQLNLPGFEAENPARAKKARDVYARTIGAAAAALKSSLSFAMSPVPDAAAILERGGVFGPRPAAARAVSTVQEPKKTLAMPSIGVKQPETPSREGFLLMAYTLPFHRATRSRINSWLLEVLPENKLLINAADAAKLTISGFDTVLVQSLDGQTQYKTKVLVVPGIRPGVVALARGFGNKQSGAAPQMIDGTSIPADLPRAAGINAAAFWLPGQETRVKITKI
jgi:anaerobic selenocysteine-containing dehydrogenase